MFLTKIELDPSRRQARRYLGSPQVMHAVVLKAAGATASSGPGRVLWRADETSARETTNFGLKPQASFVVSLADVPELASLGERITFADLPGKVREAAAHGLTPEHS